MSAIFLIIMSFASPGVRELLVPASPMQAIYAEALVAAHISTSYLVNPALAARERYSIVEVNHTEWVLNTRKERLDVLLPMNWGTLGLGLKGFHVWDLEYRQSPDDKPQKFAAYNAGVSLRYAKNFGSLCLGGEASIFSEKIYDYAATGFEASFGALLHLKPFAIGASVANLGMPVKLLNESVPLPAKLYLGASWSASESFDVFAGASYTPADTSFSTFNASLGLRGRLFDILDVYAGAGYGAVPHVGGGIGISYKMFQINYGASLKPGLGLTHHLGASFTILPKEKGPDVTVDIAKRYVEQGRRELLDKDYQKALLSFDVALVFAPENQEALEGYQKALDLERERKINLHLEEARSLRKTGDYLDALRQYEFILSLEPNNEIALAGRTDMMLKIKEAPIFTQADLPEGAINLFEAGVKAFRDDNFVKALSYWKELKDNYSLTDEINPFINLAEKRKAEQLDSLMLVSYKARRNNALLRALKLAEKALKIAPGDQRAHTQREELITLIYRKVSTLRKEAIEYFDARRYKFAAEKFNALLALDPTDQVAKSYLLKIEQEQRLTKKDLSELNLTATNAYALGDYDTAIKLWEHIVSADSTFPNIKRNLKRAKQKKELLGDK